MILKKLKKISDKLNITNSVFASVEIVINSEKERIYNFVLVKYINNKIKILEKQPELTNFNELLKFLKKKYPVIITLNGKGILIKKIAVNSKLKNEEIFRQVFPNAKLDDFYIQKFILNENNVIATIVRKTVIEKILKEFDGYFIIDINLGFLSIEHILDVLSLSSKKLSINDFRITIENNHIVDFQPIKFKRKEQNFFLEEEEIDEDLLIPFSAAVKSGILKISSTDSFGLVINRKEFKYFNFYKIIGWAVLLFCFIILFVNFLIFDALNNKNNELVAKVSSFNELINNHSDLKEELLKKEKIINDLGLRYTIRTSYIADRISYSLPGSIKLNILKVFPPVKENRKKIIFDRRKIKISGITKSPVILNEWMYKLRKLEWVEDLTLNDYNYNDKEYNANFGLIINLKQQ